MASSQQLNDFLARVERRAWRQAQYAVRDDEHALDIVQDAMLKLATRYADKSEAEWPMLFQTILQNTIRDFQRRAKLRNFWVSLFAKFSNHQNEDEADTDPLNHLPHISELNPSAEAEVDQQQKMALIEAGLTVLPARQREAFLLRYWEELDVTETAQVMGCSEGSVKTHCSRACHSLAAWLKERGVTL
ncbi:MULTISPECIES: RNA polymerase sigma factor [Deefgea]|uniref:RNA polymerase sigma factor n=1 Tax=Deefgea chitinilytica TaxID=570276 RepID=A0ABS2CEC5_9NEIS|nr:MULTISPECIES: RNA polymerase sigma factor [Deefgea]MBM5572506.1 RNA polymerase sigma factor [Deefgea chitinilytica]MBM9889742.1 RNA polymerase sigma factor [Deefgea sp. CFH1-16]